MRMASMQLAGLLQDEFSRLFGCHVFPKYSQIVAKLWAWDGHGSW
jgi:hypothetical protein